MSVFADDMERLFSAQRADRARAADLLALSNVALAAGDLGEANALGDQVESILCTIRGRSHIIAMMIDERLERLGTAAG